MISPLMRIAPKMPTGRHAAPPIAVTTPQARHSRIACKLLTGRVTADMSKVTSASPRFAALLTPQGKIIVDFIVVEAVPPDGGGFFLDCPRALAPTLVERLVFYRLRANISIEDLSAI